MIPRFGELEVGLALDRSGPWRIGLTITRGAGLEGGHREDTGLNGAGQPVSVPAHRHAVELDFVRYEWTAAYRLGEHWDAWLRVPYDVKTRTSKVVGGDGATPSEQAAMQRNLDLHHPSETLRGLSDASLLCVRRASEVWRTGDVLAFAVGSSIPLGATEEDPYARGEASLPHEHIQFGTGTFDPLVELYYVTPLAEGWSAAVGAQGRFPSYENDVGYRGPREVSSSLTVAATPTPRVGLRAGLSVFSQGFAHWDGERDVNSGLVSSGLLGGASYTAGEGLRLSLDARVPLSQDTRSADGDTFELGTVVQVGLSISF